MKKTLFVLLIAFMAICMVLVSCKSDPKPVETGDDGFLHVSTFTDFVKGLTSAKKTESKTLVLDADIAWDATKYPGGADIKVQGVAQVDHAAGIAFRRGGIRRLMLVNAELVFREFPEAPARRGGNHRQRLGRQQRQTEDQRQERRQSPFSRRYLHLFASISENRPAAAVDLHKNPLYMIGEILSTVYSRYLPSPEKQERSGGFPRKEGKPPE